MAKVVEWRCRPWVLQCMSEGCGSFCGSFESIFKAFEKAGITNLGGITSLINQTIDRLMYCDDSSGAPVYKELSHGYQQLIHCFNAFVLKKNDEHQPIHRDWQNLTITAKF